MIFFPFQQEDDAVKATIDNLLRDHLAVLSSSKTSEDGKYTLSTSSFVLKIEFFILDILMFAHCSPARARCSRVNLVHGQAVWQCGP